MNLHTKIVESYKISTHPEEIVEILNRGHALDLCMMWQTLSNHRQIFHFQTFELDLKDRMILIIYEGNKDQVDSKYPIFVKLAFREAVFKGKITEAKPNQVL